jgi:hypothetical protein
MKPLQLEMLVVDPVISRAAASKHLLARLRLARGEMRFFKGK